MMNRKHIARIVKGFGLRPVRIIPVKPGVHRIVLRRGKTYSLKRMPVSRKTLRWMDRSLRKARRNGFKRMAWRRTHTKEGRRLVSRANSTGLPYVLVPWISGRWPSVHSSRDMRACGTTLAKFHRASRKFHLARRGAVQKVGKWPSQLRRQHAFIRNMVQKAAGHKRKRRPMDRFLTQHGLEILMYSHQAQRCLRTAGYHKICRRRTFRTLCHGDGGPSNFIRNAKGMHLIDFETLRIDLRAYDLYRVIYNSCKDHAWNFAIARQILDGYQSVYKLKREDFDMLRALLRFPRSTHLLLSRYRRSNARGKMIAEQRLPYTLAAERRITIFFKQLGRYARRVT